MEFQDFLDFRYFRMDFFDFHDFRNSHMEFFDFHFFPNENHANPRNQRISYDNNKKNMKIINFKKNNENHENYRIPYEIYQKSR